MTYLNKNKLNLIFFLLCGFFLISRFYNLQNALIWEDNFSWHYRITHYIWVIESNLKGVQQNPNYNWQYLGTISYHPGVTVMNISGVFSKLAKKVYLTYINNNYQPCGFAQTQCPYFKLELIFFKIPLIVIYTFILFFTLKYITQIFNFYTALIFYLITVFEPALFISSQDLHLDYLQASFLLLTMLLFLQQSFIKAGTFFGLALLTRFASVFYAPSLIFFCYKSNYAKFLLTAMFTFWIFYPAMWINPIKTTQYIIEGSIGSSNDGIKNTFTPKEKLINYFQGFQKYFEQVIINTSIIYKVFFAIGFLGLLINFNKLKNNKEIKILIFTIIISTILINISEKKIFRYLIPNLIMMNVVLSYSLALIFTNRKN